MLFELYQLAFPFSEVCYHFQRFHFHAQGTLVLGTRKQMAVEVLKTKPQVTPMRVLKSNVKWFSKNNTQGQNDVATFFCGNHGYQNARWWIYCRPHCTLPHWDRDKMAAILKTTFSNVFPCMKIAVFWFKFHWNLFPRVQLTTLQHWSMVAPSHYYVN